MRTKMSTGVLGCALLLQGCGLDKAAVPTSLVGPSELGISLRVLANPDIVVADGIQTSVIQAVVQDQNGKRVAGRPIVFTIMDSTGRTAEIGRLTSATGARVYGSTVINTDANGIAQVVYTTPERRDLTADTRLLIGARPVGTDATGVFSWTVTLDVKSAEPRRFGGTSACGFVVSPFGEPGTGPPGFESEGSLVYPAGTVLRLSSTGAGVRYQWYYGDGKSDEGLIEVQHGYPFPGYYTLTHIVTDSAGLQSACQRFLRFD